MICSKPHHLVLLSGALLAAHTCADEGALPFSVDGFASLGAGFTLNEGRSLDADRPARFDTSTGLYDSDVSFKPDSLLGVQVSIDADSGLGVTGQITARGEDDFSARFSWAYLSYDIDDRWKILAGRQRLPVFFFSDSLDVAYTYHWVRPPTEVNQPADTLEGIQVYRATHLLFLAKRKSFADGSKATPVDLHEGSEARALFIREVLNKNDQRLKSYWAYKIFTGKGTPPPQLENEEQVKNLVATNPSCIGYIDSSLVDNSVRVVYLL